MRVLLVGAGAVGQVYGRHFQLGGADVAFLVRERYAEAARRGFDVYPLNERKSKHGPARFEGFEVFTDATQLDKQSWDWVVICVSSTALRAGTWFAELCDVIGDANVLSLTPGLEDKAFITKHVTESRAVFGLIGLLSYPGPLPGEELPEPGMVYWVPPMTKMTFSGPDGPTQAIVETLNRGGMKSKRVEDTTVDGAFAAPVLQMHMVALELTGWSFAALKRDKALMREAHAAMREAMSLAERIYGRRTPLGLRTLRPCLMRLGITAMPVVAPVDMERFFQVHFTKVGDQTVDMLDTYARIAADEGLEHDAIDALHQRLLDARGQPS